MGKRKKVFVWTILLVVLVGGGTGFVGTQSPASAGVAEPGIELQKQVQVEGGEWVDADSAPGPISLVGQGIRFRFVVVNVGDVPLSGVTLADDQLDVSGCGIPTELDPQESRECIVGPSPAVRGQYKNTAMVSASYDGELYTAQDSAFYFGADPVIHVENYVGRAQDPDWHDADTEGSALSVDVGEALWFWVEVMNTGNVTLTNVMLSDSVLDLGYCAIPSELAPGAVFDDCFVGPVDALEGLNVHVATTGGDYLGVTYVDEDPVYYLGAAGSEASISVKKYVAVAGGETWQDADDWSSAPIINDGDQLSFRFVISNTGSVTLTDIALEDDVLDLDQWANCTPPSVLEPNQEFSCVIDFGPADIDRCAHINYATVTGLYGGVLYTDNDPVHYYGPDWGTDLCPQAAALKMEPSVAQIPTGELIVFRVTAYTASGIPWDVAQQTTFEISPEALGSWSDHTYTGGRVGTWVVTGRYQGLVATVTLEVTHARVWLPIVCHSGGGSGTNQE